MNFEDKVLALFDNGRRSAVYVAGYQSARSQAASIAAEADRLIAEMAVENAELKEQLAAKDAELREALREAEHFLTQIDPVHWPSKREARRIIGIVRAALASPAAGITGTEQCVNGGTCGAGGFCDECEISPDSWQPDIEDQIGGGE